MKTPKKIFIFDDHRSLCEAALKQWQEAAQQAIAQNSRFTVALSGGKTPVAFYQKLARHPDLPWTKTHIFWVDERFVDSSHEESNYRLIRESLIQHITIPAVNIHPVFVGGGKPRDSAKNYEGRLRKFFSLPKGDVPEFDFVVLGIGADGHTASLFQGDLIDPFDRFVIPVTLSHLKYKRVSLTLSVLNSAREVVFLVTGESKTAILKAIAQEDSQLPAALVHSKHRNCSILADKPAAHSFKKVPDHRKKK